MVIPRTVSVFKLAPYSDVSPAWKPPRTTINISAVRYRDGKGLKHYPHRSTEELRRDEIRWMIMSSYTRTTTTGNLADEVTLFGTTTSTVKPVTIKIIRQFLFEYGYHIMILGKWNLGSQSSLWVLLEVAKKSSMGSKIGAIVEATEGLNVKGNWGQAGPKYEAL